MGDLMGDWLEWLFSIIGWILIIALIANVILIFKKKARNVEISVRKASEIKQSNEFLEYKYLEGFSLAGEIFTFCMLSEQGNFYFYPDDLRINIKEIISLDVVVDGTISNGLKGAVAGGLLLGGIGALTGYLATKTNSVKQIGLRFNLDNFKQPTYTFLFFNNLTGKVSIKDQHVVAAKERLYDFMSHLVIIDKRYNNSSLFSNKIDLDEELK